MKKFIIENHIPYIKGILEPFANVEYLPNEEITPSAVADADALIVRTRTRCNSDLLSSSRCSFIASATIGTDHIDLDYCRKHKIAVSNAPGCNAPAVAQYVISSIGHLMESKGYAAEALTLGIVGVGHVGSIVARWAKETGLKVILNDPPRQRNEKNFEGVTLEQIANDADIITFHVPLKDDTYHLCDETFLASCRKKPLIINSARGEVCDNSALEKAGNRIILDCWENEPLINRKLLDKALIATPHIAGYSADGKAKGTYMAAKAICGFFGIDKQFRVTPPESNEDYDIMRDDKALREDPSKFEWLRNHYPLRRDKYDF